MSFIKHVYNKFLIGLRFTRKVKKFTGYFFGSFGSIYKFSARDRLIGARLCVSGYQNKIQEQIIDVGDGLNNIKIGEVSFFAARSAFKPGELSYIYSETFLPANINPHAYETDFIKISAGDVVLDAGTCEGLFSLHALNCGADLVYMFEPAKILCTGLEKTFEFQINEKKAFLISKALSDKPGFLKFKTDEEFICMAKLDENGSDLIEVTTLDNFVCDVKLCKLDFIKADIEGAEVDFINGARDAIKKFKPKLSIAVYHRHENANEIAKIIRDIDPGYKIKFGGCYMYEKPYRPFMLYAWV